MISAEGDCSNQKSTCRTTNMDSIIIKIKGEMKFEQSFNLLGIL